MFCLFLRSHLRRVLLYNHILGFTLESYFEYASSKRSGLKVIKLEYSIKLEIKCNDWLYFESENELKLNNPEAMLPCWPIED